MAQARQEKLTTVKVERSGEMGTLASAVQERRRSVASSPGRRGQARLVDEASPAVTQVAKADAVCRASVEVIGDGWEGKAPSGAGANPSIARAGRSAQVRWESFPPRGRHAHRCSVDEDVGDRTSSRRKSKDIER